MVRVQVLLTEEEREALRSQAEKEGQSLSGWIRQAAIGKLERLDESMVSAKELRRFFAARRNQETGREPDWDEHLDVINRSRRGSGS